MSNTTTEQTPFYKRKPFLIIGSILLLALIGKLFGGNETTYTKNTETINKVDSKQTELQANEKALSEIRKEKKVIEAIVTDANVLYVSVKDDGTKRNGYAEYLCQILKENNATIDRVKITKVGSTNDPKKDNAYGVLLGECYCK
jgi:hypothetical protein